MVPHFIGLDASVDPRPSPVDAVDACVFPSIISSQRLSTGLGRTRCPYAAELHGRNNRRLLKQANRPVGGIFAMTNFGLSPAEFTELIREVAREDAQCLNPKCDARLTYRTSQRGRQALYCDDVCRRSTWRAKGKLTADLRAVLEAHEMLERPATAEQLRAAEARLRWLLARYPGDPSADDAAESHDVDQVPLAVIFARMDDDWTEEALGEAGRYDARMRLEYMNRRRRPTPVTPTLEERRQAASARERRLEFERLLESLDS